MTLEAVLVAGAKGLACASVAWVLTRVAIEALDGYVTAWKLRKRGGP